MSTKIGEKTIAKEVQAVMRNGGGNSYERAQVAVGLIESRVRRAYDVMDGPLLVAGSVAAGYAADCQRALDRIAVEWNQTLDGAA